MRHLILSEPKTHQQNGKTLSGSAMVSGRWRALSQHQLERITQHATPVHILEKFSPYRTKALCDCGAVAIALLKGCPNYCFDLST